MGFLERLMGSHSGGHHGGGSEHGRRGGHHDGGGSYGYGNPLPPQSPAGVHCPNCGTVSAQGARFCQQCGSSLAPAPCSRCGTLLPRDAKFCGSCGNAAK